MGKIKANEIEIEMPDPIPVKTTRGVTMSNNVVKMPKKRGRKKKDA